MAQKQAEERSLGSDLRALLESGAGADLTLEVGGAQLPAHSYILQARSPVFAAMLRHDMQEAHSRRIVVTDVREAVLRELLHFMYTDTTAQLDTMADELLVASDKYDVPVLKKICEQKMAEDIRVDNAAARAALAVQHSCPLLKTAAVGYLKAHGEVLATEGWLQLMRNKAEVASEICKQLAVASPPPSQSRVICDEDKAELSQRLIAAARSGRAEEVWALLKAGAPVDARDGDDNNTALHCAALNGHAETVDSLLRGGADANAVGSCNQTPLHLAVIGRNLNVVWLLVGASARLDARNDDNRTPFDVARTLCSTDQIQTALRLAAAQK